MQQQEGIDVRLPRDREERIRTMGFQPEYLTPEEQEELIYIDVRAAQTEEEDA